MKITVQVFEALFQFSSGEDWIASATVRYRSYGHTSESTIAVDSNGMICARGRHFGLAVYPVTVYAIDAAPFVPGGMRPRVPSEAA